ncbi:hypothetical protein JTE90_011050 [Oedothorax gibbosus]|uniref:Uncharacterized protein n=1 Tax=Oedothorax gibbosus TaxID=931172 RepID=A0AAV6VFK8_9ARAC|nr:hypothetical protein JTE90_011050 [Oedothorax gibbosus]
MDWADRQRAIFLTVVGPSTYGLLKNLLSPVLPTARTLEQLIAVLNQHFDPAPSEIVEILPLLVVKDGSVSLAGRNLIDILGLISAYKERLPHSANHSRADSPPRATLSSLLNKHEELFSPGLGLMKDIQVKLTPQASILPKFFKARSVPYAVRDKVDQEIDRLLNDNIIEVVKTS